MKTVRLNLLPEEYLRRKNRASRFRIWIAVAASVLCAQVVVAGLLQYKAWETRAMSEEIKAKRADQQELVKKSALLSAEQKAMARQIALALNLRKKHRWSETLVSLASSLPESVVLTNIESQPPRPKQTSGDETRSKNRTARPQGGQGPPQPSTAAWGLKIDGFAIDHQAIAQLLRTLNDGQRMGTCQLQSTLLEPFMNDYAVAFTIHARW